MSTLTYVKGLPTPIDELTPLGMTTFEMFLNDFSQVTYTASCLTVNHLLEVNKFNKSSWNTYLQKSFGINKRHANGIISATVGRVKSAKELKSLHLQTLAIKIKSAKKWISTAERRLESCCKFYSKRNWSNSKSSCLLPLACSLKYRTTNKSNLLFQVHHKKRKLYNLEKKHEHLKTAQIKVVVPKWDVFVVGSKSESFGNQVCQWDGTNLKFRVPYCLEDKYGKTLTTKLGSYERNINRIPEDSSRTFHFYIKDGSWKVALQFTPARVEPCSNHLAYGCIGIDINPGSIDWAYVDWNGNLKQHGLFKLLLGLPQGKMKAQLVGVSLKLAELAIKYKCPVVCEELDFSAKKAQLKEVSRKLARMLSGWAYAEFFKQLSAILANRGIQLKTVNPAFTSLIGLVKYVKQYGISSGVAAAISIARRGMRLREKIPSSIKANLSVKEGLHSWSYWNKLNKTIKTCAEIRNRHSYFGISNWGFLVKECKS